MAAARAGGKEPKHHGLRRRCRTDAYGARSERHQRLSCALGATGRDQLRYAGRAAIQHHRCRRQEEVGMSPCSSIVCERTGFTSLSRTSRWPPSCVVGMARGETHNHRDGACRSCGAEEFTVNLGAPGNPVLGSALSATRTGLVSSESLFRWGDSTITCLRSHALREDRRGRRRNWGASWRP